MDRWKTVWYSGKKCIECPTCEVPFRLEYIDPYTAQDFRHCPNCGERLEPPEEET